MINNKRYDFSELFAEIKRTNPTLILDFDTRAAILQAYLKGFQDSGKIFIDSIGGTEWPRELKSEIP